MKRRYNKSKVLIRVPDGLRYSTIIKVLDNSKYLVEYYDGNNMLKNRVIGEEDVIENEEYQRIRMRINKINRILE